MSTTMTPSTAITKGQAGKFSDNLVAALVKSGLPSAETQQVLATQGAALVDECVLAIRKRVEAISSLIVRVVNVVRSRAARAALEATGRRLYVTESVVKAMPKGEAETVEVCFFKPDPSEYDRNGLISDDDLEKAFDLRGLKPVDPYSLAAVNEAEPAFADDRPNGTHWKDADGNWCYAAFHRWDDGRCVYVSRRDDSGWSDGWWFAGVRK
jgi:hypothetical protein